MIEKTDYKQEIVEGIVTSDTMKFVGGRIAAFGLVALGWELVGWRDVNIGVILAGLGSMLVGLECVKSGIKMARNLNNLAKDKAHEVIVREP